MTLGKVKYCSVRSEPEVAFWFQLAKRKLDDWKLDETSKTLFANVLLAPIGSAQVEPAFSLDYSAFSSNQTVSTTSLTLRVSGKLTVYNTIEALQEVDKQKLLRDCAAELRSLITSDEFLDHPSRLLDFTLLCFADLKKYDFVYWFAFPALHFTDVELLTEPQELSKAVSSSSMATFNDLFNEYAKQNVPSVFTCVYLESDGEPTRIMSLRQFADLLSNSAESSRCFTGVHFAILDGCTLRHNPSWLVRNYLVAISYKFPTLRDHVNLLCLRPKYAASGTTMHFDLCDSLLLRVRIGSVHETGPDGQAVMRQLDCVGWERNAHSQIAPRRARLADAMQPKQLAQNAVDLNVSLMKWRVAPSLNLDAIRSKRCALFGCGTLGCNVARLLLAWGVQQLVLVDQADVSYSNPVRQSLFEFTDAAGIRRDDSDTALSDNQLRNKAHVAARSLLRVHPGVSVVPYAVSVPMPGHPVGESETAREAARQAVQTVEKIVEEADVIFLLLDSREARWLPSVVAQQKRKLVINAALGFDSFVVVRHGVRPCATSSSSATATSQLGCYFCTDVVAPTNSMRNRTLDQQCTVTRPGLSYIASAFAVELFAAVCQHPDGARANASVGWNDESDADAVLGSVPHQIRGFLSSYQFITPSTASFDRCAACSNAVVDAYERDGFEFALRVFNDGDYLEELTGLRELKLATERQIAEDMIAVLDDSDFDD